MDELISDASAHNGYYAYVLTNQCLSELKKYEEKFICNPSYINIDRYDYIFIINNKSIVGVIKTDSKIYKNEYDTATFRDPLLNQYIIRCKYKVFLDEPILIKNIFLKKKKLENITINTLTRIEKTYINKLVKLKSGYELLLEIKKYKEYKSGELTNAQSIMDYFSHIKKSETVLPEYIPLTPILINLCKDFTMPDNAKTTYFKNHHAECTKCKITNNNELPLATILSNFETIRFYDSTDKDFEKAFESYEISEPFDPKIGTKDNVIKVYYITEDKLYEHSLLITVKMKKN